MAKKGLEEMVERRAKPILEDAMQRYLGVSLQQAEEDITLRLQHSPFTTMPIDPSDSFKEAKRKFKRWYVETLLRINYGNVSETARMADIDRRSIHRVISEEDVDVEAIREEMRKAYDIKRDAINRMLEDVFRIYETSLNPRRVETFYEHIPEVSGELLEQVPLSVPTFKEAEESFEREFLGHLLEMEGWNVSKTAKRLALRPETLHRKMKKLSLERPST